jgi:tetratricopeptide (TPR) repeat protein
MSVERADDVSGDVKSRETRARRLLVHHVPTDRLEAPTSQEWHMTAASDSLTDIPGLGAQYRRMLFRAGVSSAAALRDRCATAEGRKVLAWEAGISESLLAKWYRASFTVSAKAAPPSSDEGVTTRETEFISGPRAASPAPAPSSLAAGPRLLAALGEHRVFALGTLGVAGALLFGGFAVYLRGLSRAGDRPTAVALGSTATIATPERSPEAVSEDRAGDALFRAGEFEGASVRFAAATKLDPAFAQAWLDLGRARMRLKQWDDAEDALRTAARLDGKSVAPLYYLGHVAMARGEWTKAAELCREAIRLDASCRYAWFDLGILAHRAAGTVTLADTERAPVVHTLVEELAQSEPAEAEAAMAALENLTGAKPAPKDAAGWRTWLAVQTTLGR